VADARGLADLAWLRRVGEPMTPEHWDNRMSRIMGAYIGAPGGGGAPLLLLINGRDMEASFRLPPGAWVAELDSAEASGRSTWRCDAATPRTQNQAQAQAQTQTQNQNHFNLRARSLVLLRAVQGTRP